MVTHTKPNKPLCRKTGGRSLLTGKRFYGKALLLLMVFFAASAFDRPTPPVGGDFSLDFVAAAPYTYNHATGGGAYDDRTIGKNQDVVESLEGGDFTCGDIVTFFTQIRVDANAVGSQTIQLDYSFLADATGQSGVALCDITNVAINYGNVGGDGPGGTDAGINDDGGSTATLSNETLTGPLFQHGSELQGTVTVTDLEAGETVVVRIDVKLCCQPGSSPTGNLQAAQTASRVIAPADQAGTIPVGEQTIPFKNVNQIIFPTCAISPATPVCTGTTNTYTATSDVSGATYTWTLTGNATFSGGGTTTTTTSSGTTSSVSVVAGAAGTYTLSVAISKTGYGTQTCSQTITVNPLPDVDAGAAQTLTCTTTSVQLNGSSSTAGATFSWTGPNGFTSSVANPTVSDPGTYTLTVTANGCTATDQVVISQNIVPPANVDAGAAQTLTCTSSSVQLQGSSTTAGVTYSWTGPNGFTSSVSNPTVSAPGTYTLTVTDPTNGCTATDQVIIGQNIDAPDVDAGTAATLTCTVTSVQLNGSSTTAGATFSWTGPNGFTSALEDPTVSDPGTYILTVTNPANGCTATDQVVVGQNITPPNIGATGGTITCTNTSVQLNGSSTTTGATFSWTGPNNFTSTLEDPTVTVPGTYTLTVTDPANGCTATANAEVLVNQNAPLPGTITVDQPDCSQLYGIITVTTTETNVTFTLNGPNGYTSSNTTGVFSNLMPGDYFVTISSNSSLPSCTSNIPTPYTVNPLPTCGEGCTPGYWKNAKNGWGCTAYQPTSSFWTVFGISSTNYHGLPSNLTLMGALNLGGGDYYALARHAVAALLNACNTGVDYPYTEQQIITAVQTVFSGGTATLGSYTNLNVTQLKDLLAAANELGCPLNNANTQAITQSVPNTGEMSLLATPNPFFSSIRFNFVAPQSGIAKLEIFDLMGRKLANVFQGQVEKGVQRTVDYRVPMTQRVPLIYRLTVGDKTSFGKLLPGSTD